jgi:hypothetical protein
MATRIGTTLLTFGDPRQPKALPLDHPKARFTDWGTETFILKKGTVRRRGALPLPCDILFERDVPVHLRDGTLIYVDVYRPTSDCFEVPALMAWSPYGKQPGRGNQVLDDFPFRMGVPLSKLSELQKWEGPDPAYWVRELEYLFDWSLTCHRSTMAMLLSILIPGVCITVRVTSTLLEHRKVEMEPMWLIG